MAVSLYDVKKAALTPRTIYMRRRYRDAEPLARAMLEPHYYRRSMLEFMGATAAKPDILHDYEIDADSVVIDAGAYVGDWAAEIAGRYGARVHAFEPSPHALAQLEARAGDTISVHPYGLGAVDQRATLALDGPGASTFKTTAAFGSAEIEIRDIVGVLAELGLDHVDLLKVNIEGGEYDLFDRLESSGWLDRIRLVSVQFHEWVPGAHRRRRHVRAALRRQHEEVWDYPWVWEYWRRSPI